MLLTDIRELKTILDIDPDNKAEDVKLNFLVEQASKLIEEYLNRPGLSFNSRTEYYNGTGSQNLLLRSRPVYTDPPIQVFVDEGGFYGSTSGSFDPQQCQLFYGQDFCLKIDQDNGTSRSGILVRLHAFWPRPGVRQQGYLSPFIGTSYGAIKIIYSAGYTVDDLPAPFRLACNTLVARMRYLLPLAMELKSESYEDRAITVATEQKDYLMSLVKGMLVYYRNWSW